MKAVRVPKIRDGLAPSQSTPTNGEVTKRSIRVLILEDRVNDAELMVRELRRAGFIPEWERVETENDFLALLDQEFDIILSDNSMPRFDGLRALELLKRRGSEIPFILVSSTIGDETAIEAIKQGATDYLLKGRLARLGRSVTQALEQSRLRRERAVAEEALRESEERFRQLAENIQEVFWLTDPAKNRVLYISPAYETIWGRARAEVYASARSWVDAVHPEDRDAVLRALTSKQMDGTYSEEYRIVRPDGSIRWIHDRAFLIRNGAGDIYRVVGVAQDITERKEAEKEQRKAAEAIRQSESRLRALVTSMEDVAIEFDRDGTYVAIWTTKDELLSHPRSELMGRRISDVHGEEIGGHCISAIRRVVESRSAETINYTLDVIEGSRQFLGRISPIVNADGTCERICLLSRDVTEQKKLEAQFLRAQRVESIGTLASGVAHDLNNILAPILMGAAVLRRTKMPKADNAILSTIENCAQRGADIVKQVLTFARGAEGERLLLQPAHLINDMAKIAEGTFPKTITVRTRFSESLWPIAGDPTQLHQVLLNLSVNARDAMPAGGTLTMSAENFPVDEHYASMTPGAQAGPHVLFEVKDTGMGIPRDVIDKIFDPFFTTKELGHGTGLGLSTVIGIVKSHGGFVSVSSEIGHGTTFKVFLPARMSALEMLPEGEIAVLPPANGELLLIVDDEKPILQVAQALLEGHGYRVLTAGDPTEALAIFAMRKDEIDLVLTDLVMPHMDGVALIRTLQKLKPEVKVIASTSRGGQEQHAHDLAGLNVNACLTKPYSRDKLLTTLHDVLIQTSNNQ